MALRRASRFYRMRSATFTLLLLCGLSLGTGACGTILGAEDEYVVGAPTAPENGGGVGGGVGGSAGASGSGAGQGGAGAAASGGTAGQAGASGGQAGASAGQAGSTASGAGGLAGNAGASATGGFGGTSTSGGFGGAFVGGSAGSNGGGAAGNVGTSGAGGSSAGASAGGNAGTSAAGNAGESAGGNAGASQGGTSQGGQAGSTSGAGGAGQSGGGSGGSGGAAGTSSGGSGGAGGAADPCCLGELATLLTGLEAQYKNGTLGSAGFLYNPPIDSECYAYAPPAENTTATIRFAAVSLVTSCPSIAAQVSGYSVKAAPKDAASGVCVTTSALNATVNAAVAFCPATNKIVCNTTIVQGPDAISAAACTEATCTACATAGTASVKSWLKAQDDYYVANGKFDITMAPPTDTACYDYTFVYKDVNVVKLAAAAKNAACLNFAGRTDGKPATMSPPAPAVRFSGVCSMPTSSAFSALLVDTFGVVGDCERASRGPATIACEKGATPVTGTGSVARSACGPE